MMPKRVRNFGRQGAVLYFLRAMILIDLAVGGVVVVIALLLRWHTPYEFGTGLIWAGLSLIAVAGLTATGGLAGRADDINAYSLTGAGNMSDHLKNFAQHIDSTLGFMVVVLAAAVVLVVLGFIFQIAVARG